MRETKIFNANRVSIGVGNSKYVKRNFRFRVSICPLSFQISERDFCTAGWLLPIWNSEYLKIFFDIGFIFAVLDGYSLRGLFQKRFQNCLRFCRFRRLLIRKIFWKCAYFCPSRWLLIERNFSKCRIFYRSHCLLFEGKSKWLWQFYDTATMSLRTSEGIFSKYLIFLPFLTATQ